MESTAENEAMEINFESKALARRCSEKKLRVRAWGQEGAKKVTLRLQQLQAAGTLEDLRQMPGRCHELGDNHQGHLAIDLHQPFRLILRPTENPAPKKPDGGLDWAKVDRVTVLEITDYH